VRFKYEGKYDRRVSDRYMKAVMNRDTVIYDPDAIFIFNYISAMPEEQHTHLLNFAYPLISNKDCSITIRLGKLMREAERINANSSYGLGRDNPQSTQQRYQRQQQRWSPPPQQQWLMPPQQWHPPLQPWSPPFNYQQQQQRPPWQRVQDQHRMSYGQGDGRPISGDARMDPPNIDQLFRERGPPPAGVSAFRHFGFGDRDVWSEAARSQNRDFRTGAPFRAGPKPGGGMDKRPQGNDAQQTRDARGSSPT
jgi:hypothetical protein